MTGMLRLRNAALALAGVSATTLVCTRVLHSDATTASAALLLCILLTGVYANLAEAVFASFLATLCLDYFFVPPIGSITIAAPSGWMNLSVFLLVSLVTSHLSIRLRRQGIQIAWQQSESEKLHALSRAMLMSSTTDDVRRLTINKAMELFGFSEIALFETSTGKLQQSRERSLVPEESLRRAALRGTISHGESDGWRIFPVSLGHKNYGSLAFRGADLAEATLQAFGNTVAIGFAHAQALEAGARAEAVYKSEELKSIMIDALAHDLKSPLTAIEAAAEMLLPPNGVTENQRDDLLKVVKEESAGLRRMMEEAIHLARIDAKKLKLDCRPVSVRDLIEAAVRSLGERTATHRIEMDASDLIPLIVADRELMVQAIRQLIDNAVKYSPLHSTISITASANERRVSIAVRDRGQGLTELEQGRVFDKFYRGGNARAGVQGTGMGLAIAKEIVQAHGGSAGVQSRVGQGSEFYIVLHAAAEPAGVTQDAGESARGAVAQPSPAQIGP